MTKKDLIFIDFVKKECKKHGVKCELRPRKYLVLDGNVKCGGYFDGENKKLVVAMNNLEAFPILVHEYCHLTQWLDNSPYWVDADVSIAKLFDWLSGKKIHKIQKHIDIVRNLELDNEKRAVKIIKKFDLSINIDEYTKKANAYVLFYNWLYYTRRWSKPGKAPYSNKLVLNEMSTKFNMRYNTLSKKVYNAFLLSEI